MSLGLPKHRLLAHTTSTWTLLRYVSLADYSKQETLRKSAETIYGHIQRTYLVLASLYKKVYANSNRNPEEKSKENIAHSMYMNRSSKPGKQPETPGCCTAAQNVGKASN